MSKKIIISESQYRRVFLSEQDEKSSIDDIVVYGSENKDNIVEKTAELYRLWANSTPELSKKYGKDSEFDLDAFRKPSNSGTFEKSFSKGKSQFDKDYLIVPNKYSYKDGVNVISDQNKSLFITQGGRVKYKVNTKKVLPEKLSTDDLIYDSNGNIIRGGKKTDYSGNKVYYTYYEGTGPEIIKKVRDIYSSPNTKRATDVTQKEKKSDIEKKLVSFKNTISFLEDIGLGVRDPLRGRLIPYKKTDTFKNAEDIPSDNYLFARTAINAMKYLDYLKADKTITGVKGDSTVCVTKLGSSCLGAAPYITSNTYTLNLAKVLGNKKIGNYPANYVVYDHGFYFDWGKIVKDLENKFKSDKFAYNSSLFPDGWWNYFTQSYNVGASGSFNKIVSSINSISSGDIPKIKTLNKYEGGGSIWSSLSECFNDYHCVLDIASIAALAVPGVGLMLSAGIDFANAGLYGVEAYNAETDEERDAAIIAGGLTLIGGLAGGGVNQTRRFITHASANPKVYNYVDEVIKTINREEKYFKYVDDATKNARLGDIYADAAEKYGLKDSDKIIAAGILNDFSKIDPSLVTKYTEALNGIKGNLSTVQRANLTKVASEEGFQKLVEKNNGDVIKGLNEYMGTKAGKEALVEGGLFITLTEIMEIPVVQEWVGKNIIQAKAKLNPTVKNIIQADGYDWKTTKEIFMSTGSEKDNILLKRAYENGWRPWTEGEEPTEKDIFETGILWLVENPKYQTDTFKKEFEKYNLGKMEREVAPKDPNERKEGVIYYDTKEELEQRNKIDDIITDEEVEEVSNVLDQYL